MTETTFAELQRTHMAHVRGLAERGEYPADLAQQVLTIAAYDPVPLLVLSTLAGVDLHQCAWRDQVKVTEVPGAIESHRYTVSSEDAICLLLRHGPRVFIREFARFVSEDARLARTFADLIGHPEFRPGPTEIK